MKTLHSFCFALAGITLLAACGERTVSFATDVQPIIARHCLECHADGKPGHEKSGLKLSSYDDLMRGTRFGPVVKPGDSLSSVLTMLVEGRADPSLTMPHGRAPLPQESIRLLKAWVEQGAKNN